MSDSAQNFTITIKLTTFGQVFVRAQSPEAAVRAVQQDLDHGGWTLEEDILQIENEIPHEESEAIFCDVEPDECAGYAVDSEGMLRRIDIESVVATGGERSEGAFP